MKTLKTAILIIALLAGGNAAAQTVSLTAEYNADAGGVVLTWTKQSFSNEQGWLLYRCTGAGCDAFSLAALATEIEASSDTSRTTTTDTDVVAATTYGYMLFVVFIVAGEVDVRPSLPTQYVAIPFDCGGGVIMPTQAECPVANSDAVDETILPNTLRNLGGAINNSIYNRIKQRQQKDGRWKK